ncbi:hypothetical protein JB92DRAFT_2973267 [Gautieria morchelliformis]|nr:hypothetical protein JB92DRAFT_2973267 [Gautieria morchelliformis]
MQFCLHQTAACPEYNPAVSTGDTRLFGRDRIAFAGDIICFSDKYTQRLDEDDIVDLHSGGFYKDRGVLNDKAGAWDIGCFADSKEAQNLALEEDDEEDEIGGSGSDSEFDHQFNPVHIPPVRELDPEDTEDLRAFWAAEHAWKDLHGVDDDFSGDEAGLNDNGGDDLQLDADVEESVLEVEAGSAHVPPTESDDNLAGYDDTVGGGALLWEVSSELSNCSEPLGTEVTHTSPLPTSDSCPVAHTSPSPISDSCPVMHTSPLSEPSTPGVRSQC